MLDGQFHGSFADFSLSACAHSLTAGAPGQISTICPQILQGQKADLDESVQKKKRFQCSKVKTIVLSAFTTMEVEDLKEDVNIFHVLKMSG